MKKSIALFLIAFALAAGVTLALRTARHDPHAGHDHVAQSAAVPAASDPHVGHPGSAELQLGTPSLAAAPSTTVNSICPICAMEVDPSIPSAEYQGKLVGFGCRACPPRFAADPERWGPSALKNEVLKN